MKGDARKRLDESIARLEGHESGDVGKALEAAILARLEAKSDHNYQWPRWAAAYEAAQAVIAAGWVPQSEVEQREQAAYDIGRYDGWEVGHDDAKFEHGPIGSGICTNPFRAQIARSAR